MKTPTSEDAVKIAAYRRELGKYPKPSVTADIVALRPAYGELGEGQWRENPEFSLEVLFIRRGQWPFEGCWALPGGFIHPTERRTARTARGNGARDESLDSSWRVLAS